MHSLCANNANFAKLLRWHGKLNNKDTLLRHHANGLDWRTISTRFYKNFDGEVMQLLFDLIKDVLNPFDQVKSSHITWPMIYSVYTLTWLCMKQIHLNATIDLMIKTTCK